MTFVDFALTHGLLVTDLYPSEKIRRCPTEDKPRKLNGSYLWDGQRGWVCNWSGEGKTHWFANFDSSTWTDKDQQALARKRQAAAANAAWKHDNASQRAATLLGTTVAKPHDYLIRKGLPDTRGLVLPDGALFVPMRDVDSNGLLGAQTIGWLPEEMKWEKKMLAGMRAKGAVLRLGRGSSETFLCEGYATGLSIELAVRSAGLRASVLVCFSASNMVHVAPRVKGKAYVFADHDKSGAGLEAALKTMRPYCMSPVLGEDANDLHLRAGVVAVARELMNVRRVEAPMSG